MLKEKEIPIEIRAKNLYDAYIDMDIVLKRFFAQRAQNDGKQISL